MPDELTTTNPNESERNPLARLPSITRDGVKWWATADVAPIMGYERADSITRLITNNPEDFIEGKDALTLDAADALAAAEELCNRRSAVAADPAGAAKVRHLVLLSLSGALAVASLGGTDRARAVRRQMVDEALARRTPTPLPPAPRQITGPDATARLLRDLQDLKNRLAKREPKRVTPQVREAVLPYLGKDRDEAIASELGLPVEVVTKVRRNEGWPPFRLDPVDDPNVALGIVASIQIGVQRSTQEIARWCNLTEETTRKVLNRLEREGHVESRPLDRWTARLGLVPWER